MVEMPSVSNTDDYPLIMLRNKSASIASADPSITSGQDEGIVSVRTSLSQIGVYPAAKVVATLQPLPSKTAEKRMSRSIPPTTISLRHYDNLIDELRCPVCVKPLQAPIRLCTTGHSVCSGCSHSLPKCPMCSRNFTQTRSAALEAVAAKAEFNCINAALGCVERLPADLLVRHERRCVYQTEDCFMGKVWNNCQWSGSRIDWIDHCIGEHIDKMHFNATTTIAWQGTYEDKPPAISAYYIFQVFGETFNLYQLWDQLQRRVIWTVICASKDPNIRKKYAYEIELFSRTDPFRLAVQRHACHGENDEDIIQDGRCASFDVTEVTRFMDAYRVLHYRIKIMAITYVPEPSVSAPSPRSAIKAAKDKYFNADQSSRSNSIASVQDDITGNDSSTSSFEEVQQAIASNPIDKGINENKDLKKQFSMEFSDVVRAAVRAAKAVAATAAGETAVSTLSRVNSVPKPPRRSLEFDKDSEEIKPLLEKEIAGPPPLPDSPIPKTDKVLEFAKSNVD